MEKLLLIAEKPTLMRDLQSTYNLHKNEIPYEIDFISLSGHVCTYANPKEYKGWDKKWYELPLPMMPENWKINIISDKKNIVSNIKEKIEKKNYDGFICATDADREGNLIYYLLETKLRISKRKTYRLWVHDLTESAILKSYQTMVDYHKDGFQKNLTYASILRSRFDWVVGMNATVAATVKTGEIMKIGRVKSPTIKLVYDNSNAIDNFAPTTTYGVNCEYNEGFTGTMFNSNGDITFETKEMAKAAYQLLGEKAVVKLVEKKTEKTNAPKLYKLSDLQIEANRKFGYSADLVLKLAQSLYETHKVLSYPRCDCRSISTATAQNFDKLLMPLSVFPELNAWINKITAAEKAAVLKNKKYVNDADVNANSHTALIPTGTIPDLTKLNDDEKNILEMIYKRFLAIFLPPLIELKTQIITENNGTTFKTNGKITKSHGFTKLFGKVPNDQIVPDLKNGQEVHVKMFEVTECTTTPPARLTEGQLIAEMENVQKYIDDNALKKVLKEAGGIGTPATRAGIISDIIKEGYVDKRKTKKNEQLFISEKGKAYIENLLALQVIKPELTAEWEWQLKEVEQGKLNPAVFSKNMLVFTQTLIADISSLKNKNRAYISIGRCPVCGKQVVDGVKCYGCVGYHDEPKCDFTIWKSNRLLESQGKKMTTEIARTLLSDKKCLIKGLKSSKTGKIYNAYLILTNENALEFSFENLPKKIYSSK